MRVPPDIGFAMAAAGALCVYSEFIWPGRIVPGLVGAALLAWGGYSLWQNSPTTSGLGFIGLSAALFATEALIGKRFLAGIAGTLALCWGSLLLFPGRDSIDALPALAFSATLGAVTTFLANASRQARQNKRSDIVKEP